MEETIAVLWAANGGPMRLFKADGRPVDVKKLGPYAKLWAVQALRAGVCLSCRAPLEESARALFAELAKTPTEIP